MKLDDKKLLMFDLDDTLTESKTDIDKEMSELLVKILIKYSWIDIGVISGCAYPQMIQQFFNAFSNNIEDIIQSTYGFTAPTARIDTLSRFYLMPASGSQLYHRDNSLTLIGDTANFSFECEYKESLTLREKAEIYNSFFLSCDAAGVPAPGGHGEIGEDRDSQITFSFFGQEAPLDIKKPWDPDQSKRLRVAHEMQQLLPDYQITVGGSSSIDVTRKGADKAYGVKKFLSYKGKSAEDVLFVADALFTGGNDYPVKEMGVDSIEVAGPEATKVLLRRILGEE